MASEIFQPGSIHAESSQMTGTSNNAPPGETQQQCRHQCVHRTTAIVAPKIATEDARLAVVRKTGTSKFQKQHAI